MYIVEKPYMQPKKDYEDYTWFINDTFSEEKNKLLSSTLQFEK
jgi:hypothetical protein